MNFFADESVDQPIISRLRADGHLIEAVSEMDPGIQDDEVLERATTQGSLLLTADKDFGELIYRQRLASMGIVLIRLSGLPAQVKANIVSKAIQYHADELWNAFSVIEHSQVRIRRQFT